VDGIGQRRSRPRQSGVLSAPAKDEKGRRRVSGFAVAFRMERQEVTVTMRTIALALALASALFSYAPKVMARPAESRGAVEVKGPTVKVVTTGPVLIHAYSGFSGGALFLAPLVAGTVADCSTALANHGNGRPIPLVADRVAYVPVAVGQVACLRTDTGRSFELLWHAFATSESKTRLAQAKSR